ncbi:MAG: hypothetical protein DCF22_16195 [Leptolyngbya sp.]|nr:MAG: hypothetical protein DCF22_16195 [Leptolyngbya sp.]
MNIQLNGSRIAKQEQEWELQEASHYSQFEMEGEAENEYFFQTMLSSIQKAAKAAAPIAKQLAPIAARTLMGAIPRVGAIASPTAARLISQWVQEGEMEAVALESQFFGSNEMEAEVSNAETAYEAALTEVLAAEASHSNSESEAAAFLGSALPTLVNSMGGQKALRRILPILVSANSRLVRLLHRQGTTGQRLLRLIPTILRRTVASLRVAAQKGQPMTSDLALRLMASHTHRVFGNSQTVTRSMIRNAIIQRQTVAKG